MEIEAISDADDIKEYVPNIKNFRMTFIVLVIFSLAGFFGLVDLMFFVVNQVDKIFLLITIGPLVPLLAYIALINRKKIKNRIFLDARGISEVTYKSKKTLAWNDLVMVKESLNRLELFGKSQDAPIRIYNEDYPYWELRQTIADKFSRNLSPDLPMEIRTESVHFTLALFLIFCFLAVPFFLCRQMYQKISVLIIYCLMTMGLVAERLNKEKITNVKLEKDLITFQSRGASVRVGLTEIESVTLLRSSKTKGKYLPTGVCVRIKDGVEFKLVDGLYAPVHIYALLKSVLRAHADRDDL